jgi:hypothetical protein
LSDLAFAHIHDAQDIAIYKALAQHIGNSFHLSSSLYCVWPTLRKLIRNRLPAMLVGRVNGAGPRYFSTGDSFKVIAAGMRWLVL